MPTPPYLTDLFGVCAVLLLYASGRRHAARTPGQALFEQLLLCCAAAEACAVSCALIDGRTFFAARALHIALLAAAGLLLALFGALWITYTDSWTSEGGAVRKRPYLIAGLPALMLAVLLFNWKFGFLYRVDAANRLLAGPYARYAWSLCGACFLFAAGLAFVRTQRAATDRAARRRMRRDSVFLLIAVGAFVLQTAFPTLSLFWPATSLALLTAYIGVQQRRSNEHALESLQQAQRTSALENELTQNRVAIMLSQIQPHFLYNALTTIVDLCDTDAQLAKRATIAFSQYLRGNMDSLKQVRPVPFPVEKKHVENYLWLEKLRFGDELHIVWDVAVENFLIPALTVQPLVENAVKYGVGKKSGGGTVTISTRETPFVYIVTVADDGVGFEPTHARDDGRTHVGIDSVRSRLHYQCGGALSIESEPGRGTKAVITLLKERST